MSLTTTQPALPALLSDRAQEYANLAAAPRTAAEYTADLAHFSRWCSAHGHTAMPALPEVVGSYLAAYAGELSVATLKRRLAALSSLHRQAGMVFDTRHRAISMVMTGISRVHGTAQRRVEAATNDVVTAMVATCDGSLAGLRDRALLLLGFASAMRRSELVALTVADLKFGRDALVLTIRRSKTDQKGAGRTVVVKPQAVIAAVQAWLAAASIKTGLIFRSVSEHGVVGEGMVDRTVARIIKGRAEKAGLDPAQFSGHSLRAGFATEAASRGAEERVIARTTGHTDMVTLRRYIRGGTAVLENASDKLGL